MSVDPEATPTGNSADTEPAPVDWEKRAKDTQAAYTRSQQELAALQKLAAGEDPDQFQTLLDKYGYELDGNDDEQEPEEPEYDEQQLADDPRLQQFEKFMTEQQAKEQQQAIENEWTGWEQYMTEKAAEHDVQLSKRELNALKLDCLTQNGLPVPPAQAEKALAEHLEWRNSFIEENTKQRRRPRAPHVPAGGEPVNPGDRPKFNSDSDRLQWQMERIRADQA
jgi:hypothetical protein